MRYKQQPYRTLIPVQMARARRAKLFSAVTGLKEVNFSKQSRAMAELIPPHFSDHESVWTDGSSLFILTEPYCQNHPPHSVLDYILVPVKFAPYGGGGFTDSTAATPWTKSFLYARPKDTLALRDIENSLLLANYKAPLWNEV